MSVLADLLSHLSGFERQILEQRAQTLSHPLIEDDDTDRVALLTAFSGGEIYAISVEDVREIRPLVRYTRVPSVPAFVLGVLNLRGMILSLIDLRQFLGSQSHTENFKSVIVVKSDRLTLGIAVDRVGEVVEVALSDFNRGLLTQNIVDENYVYGVTSEGLVWLNIRAILDDPKLIIRQDMF